MESLANICIAAKGANRNCDGTPFELSICKLMDSQCFKVGKQLLYMTNMKTIQTDKLKHIRERMKNLSAEEAELEEELEKIKQAIAELNEMDTSDDEEVHTHGDIHHGPIGGRPDHNAADVHMAAPAYDINSKGAGKGSAPPPPPQWWTGSPSAPAVWDPAHGWTSGSTAPPPPS
eukprot:1773066-Pyramimonas_sp.AAC.1